MQSFTRRWSVVVLSLAIINSQASWVVTTPPLPLQPDGSVD
jgi:hypothetical protein